jgi:hypothetical protein
LPALGGAAITTKWVMYGSVVVGNYWSQLLWRRLMLWSGGGVWSDGELEGTSTCRFQDEGYLCCCHCSLLLPVREAFTVTFCVEFTA